MGLAVRTKDRKVEEEEEGQDQDMVTLRDAALVREQVQVQVQEQEEAKLVPHQRLVHLYRATLVIRSQVRIHIHIRMDL